MWMYTNNKHQKLAHFSDHMFVLFSISSKKEKECSLYIYFLKNH